MDEFARPVQHLRVLSLVDLTPLQARTFKGLALLRVRYVVIVPAEHRKLLLAAGRDGLCHLLVIMVREVLKRCGRRELLALKEHGDERCSHHESQCNLGLVSANDVLYAVSDGTVADLVVVLDVAKEVMR